MSSGSPPNSEILRRLLLPTFRRGLALLVLSVPALAWTLAGGCQAPAQKGSAHIPHPSIRLLDSQGANVLESRGPVSTRASCGPCHDYDFITDCLHFQQGRNEMAPVLVAEEGLQAFHTSPGMFGKYSFITNRQLARKGLKSPEDFDMGVPEWLLRCGVCHAGGGPAEMDLRGRSYLSVPSDEIAPLAPGYNSRHAETGEIVRWDWLRSGVEEANCFLCHLPAADFEARKGAIGRGEFGWAVTATLAGWRLAERDPAGGFRYLPSGFSGDGKVLPERLPLSQPRLEGCGFCHGFTARKATSIPSMEAGEVMRCAEKAGWIYNGARIKDTVFPSIAGRGSLDLPWDVHAAAGIECVDCHFSPNNPARRPRADLGRGLSYRPGDEDPGLFLKRPDHNLARGCTPPVTVDKRRSSAMRGCADCHDTSKTHTFLPCKELHFRRLACQACHIPAIRFWAYRSQDWAVLLQDGGPRTSFRGIEGPPSDPRSTVTGFRPAFIADPGSRGERRLRPVNPISGTYWYDRQKRRPVFTWQLRRAFFEGKDPEGRLRYRPECLRALDADGDGQISFGEAVLDTERKVAAIATLLRAHAGVKDPELRCVVVPWAMSHSTVGGRHAVRECGDCHSTRSILRNGLALCDAIPPGARLFYLASEIRVIEARRGGTTFDNTLLMEDFYILGGTRLKWVELLGRSAVLLAALASVAHGVVRFARWRMP